MNRRALFAALLLGAAVLSAAPALRARAEPPAQTAAPETAALASLRSAEHFALGGVGFAGTTSEGEKAFRQVLARPDAVASFERLLTDPKAGNAARLYALLGLRWKDALPYKKVAADMRGRRSALVDTMAGCMAARETVAGVAARIDDGKYDILREPRRPVAK